MTADLLARREPRQARRVLVETTPLQDAIVAFAATLEQLERLPSRERAVAIDIAHRRLAQALVRQRAVLEEWAA